MRLHILATTFTVGNTLITVREPYDIINTSYVSLLFVLLLIIKRIRKIYSPVI